MRAFLYLLFLGCVASLRAASVELPPTPLSDPAMNPSPLSFFRKLLDSSESARITQLSQHPEKVRLVLRRKISEYEALTPAARELRLQATELRYYLRPLLSKAEGYRKLALQGTPEKFRVLVQVRLERWDELTPETREKILANEWMLHAVLRYGPRFTTEQAKVNLPVALADRIDRETGAWQSLSPERQQRLIRKFQEFFVLDPIEKERVVAALPEYSRFKVGDTLNAMLNLAEPKRADCMIGLERFALMDPIEQAVFMQNAEVWQKLSENERAAWRRVVSEFPPLPEVIEFPPLPPGFGEPPPAPIQLLSSR